jgi:hypothetical protein
MLRDGEVSSLVDLLLLYLLALGHSVMLNMLIRVRNRQLELMVLVLGKFYLHLHLRHYLIGI